MEVRDEVTMAKVWKHLPPELHGNILQFFSIPELCRLRVVCRAWNDLTHKLDFALRVRSKDMCLFTTPHAINLSTIRDWPDENRDKEVTDVLRSCSKVFEPSTRTSYPISMECLYAGMRSRVNLLDECRIMAAADRGFVWVLWSQDLGLMQVANLVTKSVVEIPPLDKKAVVVEISRLGLGRRWELSNQSFFEYVAGAMSVAENHSSFTLYVLFAIERETSHSSDFELHVVWFDSKVGKWQQKFSITMESSKPIRMVELNDTLYIVTYVEKGCERNGASPSVCLEYCK